MNGGSDTSTWLKVLAIGIVLRPILVVPMAPSGPLGGSTLLPIGLAVVFGLGILVAVGVLLENRLAVAFATLTTIVGIPVALVGLFVGLPMPWPLLLVGYNVVLAAIGVTAWRELTAAER